MIFNLRTTALKLFAIILIFLSFQTIATAQQKPNVIFILSDDVGYDILSVNGNKTYSTPNIDSMAHHSIDGKITASATGGIPPYFFSFNNGDFDTTSHFVKLSKGDYSITVEDSNKCTVSETAEVNATNQSCATDITVSPNPSNSFFRITIGANLISNHIKIAVYNERGRLVYLDHGTQITSYKFGNSFEPGIYLVKIEADSNKYVFRIIKN